MGTAALAARLRDGDQSAFAELYNEYAERLFGFCVVLLRDRDEAADAMHDTFVLAAQRVHQLRDLERLRPWLFAIARHVCYRRLAQRKRSTPTEIEPDVLVLDTDPDARLSADDAAALVWAAAASLNERDRAVLDLSLREGLLGADLAAALGVEQANPHSLLYRAKEQLERAIGVLVVARAGRSSCPTLAGMLRAWDGTLTPIVRKRLGRHMNRCIACQATRSRALPVSALAVAPMLKPAKAQAWSPESDTTIGELLHIAQRRPDAEERWQDDGFPPLVDRVGQRRRRAAFLVVGLVGVVLVAALTVGELSAGDDPANVAAADPNLAATREPAATTTVPVSTTTTMPAATTTTVPSNAPALPATDPVVVPVNTATTVALGVVRPPVSGPPATSPPSKEPPVTNPPGPATTKPPVTTPVTTPPRATTTTVLPET